MWGYHCKRCGYNVVTDDLPVYECGLCGAGAECLEEERKPSPDLIAGICTKCGAGPGEPCDAGLHS